MYSSSAKKTALKVSYLSILANFILTAFKIVAGIIGNSSAMISDGVHSFSDVLSTIIVIIGIFIASRPTDKSHPYGHERLECACSVVLAVLLFGTGIILGYNGVKNLVTGEYKYFENPTILALIAAVISIIVKEAMFWITIIKAKKINSLSLKADAWHHRSDALSSIGSLLGIGATIIFDMPIFDIIASLIICLFILKIAIDIFKEAIRGMTDESCSPEKEEELKNILYTVDGVLTIDEIKTRIFGNRIYIDIEIGVNQNLPLLEAHDIAESVHTRIEKSDDNIKHCMVHVNPVDPEKIDKD